MNAGKVKFKIYVANENGQISLIQFDTCRYEERDAEKQNI